MVKPAWDGGGDNTLPLVKRDIVINFAAYVCWSILTLQTADAAIWLFNFHFDKSIGKTATK